MRAGVPEDADCDEWVAIIGAVTCAEETWDDIGPRF